MTDGLHSVRAEVAERQIRRDAADDAARSFAMWSEMFLSGERAQFVTPQGFGPLPAKQNWPAGKPVGRPLDHRTIRNVVGQVFCLQPQSAGPAETLLVSYRRPSGMRADSPFDMRVSVREEPSELPQATPWAPPLFAGRGWANDWRQANLSQVPYVKFVSSDPAKWIVERREVKDGRAAVRVWLPLNEPPAVQGRPAERRAPSEGFLAWFTDDAHHDLFRVEHALHLRGDVAGDEAAGRRMGDVTISQLREYRPLPDGGRMPFAGTTTAYRQPNGALLARGVTEEGGAPDHPAVWVSRLSEWRVQALEPLDPTAELWIDPPEGVYVNNGRPGPGRIAGATRLWSWLILTTGSRDGPYWALGPPVGLVLTALLIWVVRRRHPARRGRNADA
ncbi:hypothetical protein [Alienimonas californiensis]|uniref:Uncharacterized protein n=1 Tax=Alienimonas californiensis TaxID=2527989 RepID=A0A517PCD3_9PLAN|nr:hypothetical protein [Alienimonas californiensis]QDT17057.1 hypothetical protein CA12_31680 [Alienimonas californiensis]